MHLRSPFTVTRIGDILLDISLLDLHHLGRFLFGAIEIAGHLSSSQHSQNLSLPKREVVTRKFLGDGMGQGGKPRRDRGGGGCHGLKLEGDGV